MVGKVKIDFVTRSGSGDTIPDFCAAFAEHVRTSPAIRDELTRGGLVPSLRFEFALQPIPETAPSAHRDLPWWRRVWGRLT